MIDRRALLAGGGAVVAAGLLFMGRATRAAAPRFPVTKTPAQWRQQLGPDRFRILREAGTERSFTSPLNDEHRRGTFVCVACANPLFASATKYDSGTGWPSFFKALPHGVVTRGPHNLFFGTEILCARCGGHLGHVFGDGPKPTGLRYCMNGLALRFQPA
ncbi:MAG: peptide-methionine (R)-S-oxide reductase MsrB [Sphingomicrobium sp.]